VSSIDDTGYHRTRLDERTDDLISEAQAIVGADTDLGPHTQDGQLLTIFAEKATDCDEKVEYVFNGIGPSGATGVLLARQCALTGTIKKTAQYSRILGVTLAGDPGKVIPAGSRAASDVAEDGNPEFASAEEVTLDGAGAGTVDFIATTYGPVPCPANHLVTIVDVIDGWDSVTNPGDAAKGRLVESDPALRRRQRQSVAGPSQGILDGLHAALLALDGVFHAKVWENPTGSSDVSSLNPYGLPPHSINAIVDGGDAADIAEAIWQHKSSGVTQVGAQTADVIDSQGSTQTMLYDRPIEVLSYVTVTMFTAVSAETKNAIIAAIAEAGDLAAAIGGRVQWSNLVEPVKAITSVPIVSVALGNAPSPTLTADMQLTYQAIDRWDATPDNAGRILVLP
jgi:uncharacterized phage protein gp47/JayE